MSKSFWSFLLICVFFSTQVRGQGLRSSEAEIALQDLFIQAHRAKTILKNEEAIELYREVLKKDGTNSAAAYELARLYKTQKDDQLTRKYAKKAIDLDPKNPWYKFFYGKYLEEMEAYSEAATIFEKLILQEPNEPTHYLSAASNQIKMGSPEKALQTYRQLDELQGITEEITKRKFNLLNKEGRNEEAARAIEKLIENDPHNIPVMNHLAGFYRQIGQQEKANQWYRKILELDPNNSKALMATNIDSNKNRHQEDYIQSIMPLLANPEIDLDAKIKELIPFVMKGSTDKESSLNNSLKEAAEILDKNHPNIAKVKALYGDILMNLYETEKATIAYGQAIEINPRVWAVWDQYLFGLNQTEQYQKLLQASENAMDIYPNQVNTLYHHAYALNALSRPSEAMDYTSETRYMADNKPDIQYQIKTLEASINLNLNNPTKAKKLLDECKELNPDLDSEGYNVLGDYYFEKGDKNKALESWQKAQKFPYAKASLEQKILELSSDKQ